MLLRGTAVVPCDVDGAAAGEDDDALAHGHCGGRVARRSLCVFRRLGQDREAVSYVQRSGARCCVALLRCVVTWLVAPQLVRTIRGDSTVLAVAVSCDGRYVYSGNDDETVKQWDVSSGAVRAVPLRCGSVCDVLVAPQLVGTMEGHLRGVSAVAVSPDGRFVYSGSLDKTVKQWDASKRVVRGVARRRLVGNRWWRRSCCGRWDGTWTRSMRWPFLPTVALCIPGASTRP